MSFRTIPVAVEVYCNIYNIKNGKYIVVKGVVREIWQRAWDPRDYFYIPNLLTCPLPNRFSNNNHLAVSITVTLCNSNSKALLVRGTERSKTTRKNGIAICVKVIFSKGNFIRILSLLFVTFKGMDFLDDISQKLIEWIEMQFLLGADTITVYTYYIHPKVQKVLDYYSTKRFLTVVFLILFLVLYFNFLNYLNLKRVIIKEVFSIILI